MQRKIALNKLYTLEYNTLEYIKLLLKVIVMFINREQELNNLEHRYRAKRAELFVLYGRRRIGKTELLLQFCKDKRSIYFLASQLKESDHLMQINEVAQIAIETPWLRNIAFNDWESALVYFAQNATEEPLSDDSS